MEKETVGRSTTHNWLVWALEFDIENAGFHQRLKARSDFRAQF
jgi:hypothetical protein